MNDNISLMYDRIIFDTVESIEFQKHLHIFDFLKSYLILKMIINLTILYQLSKTFTHIRLFKKLFNPENDH